MWSRISNLSSVLKTRPGTPGPESENERSSDVLTGVYNQHPNISVLRSEDTERPVSKAEPPASWSKSGRKNMFKRMSRAPQNENVDTFSKGTLPKKVLSSLQNIGSGG